MLRPALVLLLAAATAGAATASAAPARTAAGTYTGPAVAIPRAGTLPAVTVVGRRIGGVASFDTLRTERTVRVSLLDDAGNRVGASVTQTIRDEVVQLGSFCGTSAPLRLAAPGQPVRVAVSTACGTPTRGSLRVTFG